MSSEPQAIAGTDAAVEAGHDSVEMPRPTAAPMVLSLGLVLMAAGVATGAAFLAVGAATFIAGLGLWVAQLLPGRGHIHEPLVERARRAAAVQGAIGRVEHLHRGMPGYRLRLPTEVHPISAGIKGGLVGGLVMPLPAAAYGLLSGHGLWYPVNLLAGTVHPGIGDASVAELERFSPSLLVVGLAIHMIMSLVLGMIYGVLLPTLPHVPRALAWSGLLIPMVWTGLSYLLMGAVNPLLRAGVEWPWFIASQFIFGIAAALAILQAGRRHPVAAGVAGGVVGGLLMPIPAVLWSVATGRGIWYPANLLAGMVVPGMGKLPAAELTRFHADWLAMATVIHAVNSLAFAVLFSLLLPRLPRIPTSLSWGGLLVPLLWTALSFGLMGVVNPVLQKRVDWPWFVVSQFIFGVAAAVVVVRSEKVHIPPAGRGPDRLEDYVAGQGEGGP